MPKVIYQYEWDFMRNRNKAVPCCSSCYSRLSLLGLLDENKKLQYICPKCNKKVVEE